MYCNGLLFKNITEFENIDATDPLLISEYPIENVKVKQNISHKVHCYAGMCKVTTTLLVGYLFYCEFFS